jgi:hypothetical protein
MEAMNASASNGGLSIVAYPGDNKILLAMSLADGQINGSDKNLAGFAIWRTEGSQPEQILSNRIGFTYGVSAATTPADRKWIPSNQAPFQKFRWIDVPLDGFDQPITYRVKALYFAGASGTKTVDGPEVKVTVNPVKKLHNKFRPAFTRGYIASQAYVDKFHNAPIRPDGAKTPDFDSKPYKAQYEWLGADAHTALFDFIADCEQDKQAKIDVFAYDIDHPDVVAAICRIGKEGRLRAILDNAPLHTAKGAAEIKVAQMVIAAAGKANVKQGHFARFQHNKVFIKRDASGTAQRVLYGSMNFSIRGLYVQANNIIVVDDAGIAGMFARAFEVAFQGNVQAGAFKKDHIADGYMVGSAQDTSDLPLYSLALSPHADWTVSLGPMAERIRAAKSSVLYAVMAPTGQGPVLASLRQIAAEPTVFSYGTVETDMGLAVQKPDGQMGGITGFAALLKHVPPPFDQEWTGGAGMHIHSKYVVVDFNGDHPTVFTGSSNLASGGEMANGDSLSMIEDAAVANMYAVEAVATFDHYHFRDVMQKATSNAPLTLWYPGKQGAAQPWWAAYYDKTRIQFRDRCLFAEIPLPPDLQTTKNVNWSAIGAAAPAAKGKAKKPAKRAKPAAAAKPKKKAKVVKIKPKKPPRKPAGGKGRKRAA